MKKLLLKLNNLMPSKRRFIQLYCALLFNANLKGFVSGNIFKGDSKLMCAPGINCYSCPGAIGACPLGSLQGSFSADRSTLYYVCGILLLYGLMFGRMICGWFCPFGLIQELLYKIKTPKLKKNRITRILSYLKYIILVVFVFIIPIMYAFKDTPFPAFCKYICPAGTLEGGIGLLANKVNASYFSMLGPLFTWKFVLMISIIVGSVFVFRLFCRFICPLGALYGIFNRFSIFGIKLERSKCVDCGLCLKQCKVDIRHVGDQECISCGECINVCPTKAISFKGKIFANKDNDTVFDERTKKKQLITKWISLIVLLVFLGIAIFYAWNDDSQNATTIDPGTQNGDVITGNEVGNLCPGYDLEIIDQTGITTSTINPVKTGKLTIINFWGTWCTPCVNELPYFDRIASEYSDTVTVIAIHTNMIVDTAYEFIDKYYSETTMIFAHDTEGEAYYSTLGGRGTYPYTVVLDENGIILKIFYSSLKYEDLKEVVTEYLS